MAGGIEGEGPRGEPTPAYGGRQSTLVQPGQEPNLPGKAQKRLLEYPHDVFVDGVQLARLGRALTATGHC